MDVVIILVPEAKQTEFCEEMAPDQLHDYLLDKQIPEDDCQKIKGDNYNCAEVFVNRLLYL